MTSRLEVLRTCIAAVLAVLALGGLAVDLGQTAYAAAHTARMVVLATAS